MKGGARRLPELAGARPPPSSSSTAPAPARSGPQETGEVRGLEGGAAAVLHLSSWRGRRGLLLHGSAAAAVDVQGSAGGREERNAGRKGGAAARLRGRSGAAARQRGRSGGSSGCRVRGVVMGLLVGWALHSSWAFSLFFLLFSFLFPFILLIYCFYVGV